MFLNEDEVPSEVSSLKDTPKVPVRRVEEPSLGLVNASFKWNEVTEKDEKGKTANRASLTESERTLPGSDSEEISMDHKFELKNVSVAFPERELTLVTGPTARYAVCFLVSKYCSRLFIKVERLRCWSVPHSPPTNDFNPF